MRNEGKKLMKRETRKSTERKLGLSNDNTFFYSKSHLKICNQNLHNNRSRNS